MIVFLFVFLSCANSLCVEQFSCSHFNVMRCKLSFNSELELIQLHFQFKRLVRFQLTQQCV